MDERQHLETLLQTHEARLRILEQQDAITGINTRPEVLLEIAQLQPKIAHVKAMLAAMETGAESDGSAASSSISARTRRRTNLPAPATAMIGRLQEATTVRSLLLREDVRLVTLSGPGGIGKTRLAIQVATDMLDDFTHGVQSHAARSMSQRHRTMCHRPHRARLPKCLHAGLCFQGTLS
jgi:predicted ribonuclease YlaK